MTVLFSVGAKAQTWNFQNGIGEPDITNLNADATNWTYDATNTRWCSVNPYTIESLSANGTEISFAQGLFFTSTVADAIRLDNKKKCLTLNKANTAITIKNLTKDTKITVNCVTSSKTTARGLNVTNITPVSGSFNSTSLEAQTNVGTVTADGDVTLTTTGGLYIYTISVGEGGGNTPEPDNNYNSVSLNTNKNQIRLTLKNSDIKYYNTEDISVSVDNNAGTVTVNPLSGDWSDVYTQNVSDISFAKAQPSGSEGDITNTGVEITEAKGWLESAYVKWNPYTGATSYNVYVKGGQYSDYTKIDYQLVRDYTSYGRADVVGLKAGTYSIKVVPVVNDVESTDAASEATSILVKNYDRSGFAHFKNSGVGAYNDDGTLKDGAVVLYITKDNFNTIQYDITVGNAKETRTGLGDILQAFEKGTETRPFAIRFIGQVTADTGQLLGEANSLQLKGKGETSNMNVTFEGIGDDATWYGWGMTLSKCANVEVRNIATMLFPDDGIQLKEGYHVWIHHNDIFYGNAGSDSDQAKGDGSLDTKDSGSYNTFSYNHFWDSGKCSLCGMKGENTDDYESYHHNWFDHSDSRHPRVRTKTIHVYNNYYDGVSKYGVGATMGSSVFVENNYFRSSKNPMLISKQGRDAMGDGTFSGENGGMIKSFGNIYTEKGTVGSYTPITHKDNATSFDCYEAETREEQVPSSYTALVGGTTYNNFDTNNSLMYAYTPDATAEVPAVVTGFYGAGRLNHGDFQWTFNNSIEDTNYNVIKELKTALQNYKTNLKGIFTGKNNEGGNTGGETGGNTGGETGGNTGGETGGETGGGTTISAAVECNFENSAPSNNAFTVTSGSYSTSRGSATVNGTTYTRALKIDSKVSVTFETTKDMTLTLVVASGRNTLALDGTTYTGDSNNVITVPLPAGPHKITKGGSEGALFYIGLSE